MNTVGMVVTHQCSDVWLASKAFDKALCRVKSILNQCGIKDIKISRNCFTAGHVPDIYPQQGVLSALHAALFYQTHSHVLCVPPDMPGLSVELIRWLLVSGRIAKRSCHYRDYSLPMYLHNDKALRERLEYRLSEGLPVNTDNIEILKCRSLVAPDPSRLVRIFD